MSRSGLNKGLDSYVHSVILNPDQHVALTLYDSIYPQGRGKSLSANFFKRVQAVILLCSVDNENSLLRLRYWLDEAKHYIKDPHPVFIVVATKCDLDRNIEITDESLQNFGAYNDLPTFQVSAKTNSGIHAMLRELASRFVDQQARSGHISLTPLKSNEQQPLLDPSCNVGEDEPLTVRDFDNGSCFSSCCTIL
jgi:GTPase SAR1 family protein